VETLTLQRLWKLSTAFDKDPLAWPADSVRRALQVVLAGERAAALACANDESWEPRAFRGYERFWSALHSTVTTEK